MSRPTLSAAIRQLPLHTFRRCHQKTGYLAKIRVEDEMTPEEETTALIHRLTHPSQFARDLARRACDPSDGKQAAFIYLNVTIDDGELLTPELLAISALLAAGRLPPPPPPLDLGDYYLP